MAQIQVKGLREVQAALRKVDSELPKALRRVNLAAAEIVAQEARRRAPVKTGKLRKSIKAQGQQRGASVKGGTPSRVPYFGFIDFGGVTGRYGNAKRPFIKDGRIIYPSVARRKQEALEFYERAVDDLIKKAGLDK